MYTYKILYVYIYTLNNQGPFFSVAGNTASSARKTLSSAISSASLFGEAEASRGAFNGAGVEAPAWGKMDEVSHEFQDFMIYPPLKLTAS